MGTKKLPVNDSDLLITRVVSGTNLTLDIKPMNGIFAIDDTVFETDRILNLTLKDNEGSTCYQIDIVVFEGLEDRINRLNTLEAQKPVEAIEVVDIIEKPIIVVKPPEEEKEEKDPDWGKG